MIYFIYKTFRRFIRLFYASYDKVRTVVALKGNGVKYSSFRTNGIPYIVVARGGKMAIGKNFAMNNGIAGNPIGCYEHCTFFVDRGCTLRIGDNVGISQAAFVAHADLTIGNNVKIGGGYLCVHI